MFLMSKSISGNKLRLGGRRHGNFVYDSAIEIIAESIACSINGRFMWAKMLVLYFMPYKSKIQVDWRPEYKKQNSKTMMEIEY